MIGTARFCSRCGPAMPRWYHIGHLGPRGSGSANLLLLVLGFFAWLMLPASASKNLLHSFR